MELGVWGLPLGRWSDRLEFFVVIPEGTRRRGYHFTKVHIFAGLLVVIPSKLFLRQAKYKLCFCNYSRCLKTTCHGPDVIAVLVYVAKLVRLEYCLHAGNLSKCRSILLKSPPTNHPLGVLLWPASAQFSLIARVCFPPPIQASPARLASRSSARLAVLRNGRDASIEGSHADTSTWSSCRSGLQFN